MKDFIVFAVSDGTATTARTVVQAALAQFPEVKVEVKMRPQVKTSEEIVQFIRQAKEEHGIIAYTLVSPALREVLLHEARIANVASIDLLGPLLLRLEEFLKVPPRGTPGTFKPSSYGYDPRIEAINFTVDHDDGKGGHSLDQADIVLLGVSRTSKTPLSVYLAFRGWKVANVPIITGVEPFEILSRIDQRKIIGLTIEAERLAGIRKKRMEKFNLEANLNSNLNVKDTYSEITAVQKEISYAESLYRTPPVWPVIDVTHKSIEEIAQEVITALTKANLANADFEGEKPGDGPGEKSDEGSSGKQGKDAGANQGEGTKADEDAGAEPGADSKGIRS